MLRQSTAAPRTWNCRCALRRDGETPPFEIYRERYADSGASRPPPMRSPLADADRGRGRPTYFHPGRGRLDPQGDRRHCSCGVGTTYREAYRLRRSIREDDPNSAEMEAEAINTYERGEWRIKLRAHSLCRSSAHAFPLLRRLSRHGRVRARCIRAPRDKKIPRVAWSNISAGSTLRRGSPDPTPLRQ